MIDYEKSSCIQNDKFSYLFNSIEDELYFFGCKKIILFILVIIISIQFTIKNSNNGKDKRMAANIKKVNRRLFLIKEDEDMLSIDKKKNKIQIVMTTDNEGIYITLVSITSSLYNNNKDENILIFHLFVSHDFNMDYLKYFESLKQQYVFILNIYQIPNIFKYLKKWRNSVTVYYKLLIPIVFNDFERIIYLDSDTLIFKDMYEMYNLPFNNSYVLGYPFHTAYMIDKLGINAKYYINAGVMLLNIEQIRKDNKDIELLEYTFHNSSDFLFLEQDTLNYVYLNRTGFLPLKYGIYLYGNIQEFISHYSHLLRVKLDIKEVKKAIKDPSIIHLCCCVPKVWIKGSKHERYHYNKTCTKYQKKFYFYANKTKYYDEIYNKYMK